VRVSVLELVTVKNWIFIHINTAIKAGDIFSFRFYTTTTINTKNVQTTYFDALLFKEKIVVKAGVYAAN